MTIKSTTVIYTDQSPFPFGKYRGEAFEDIPAAYFHWVWHNCNPVTTEMKAVFKYIENNIDAFKCENRDLIWSK